MKLIPESLEEMYLLLQDMKLYYKLSGTQELIYAVKPTEYDKLPLLFDIGGQRLLHMCSRAQNISNDTKCKCNNMPVCINKDTEPFVLRGVMITNKGNYMAAERLRLRYRLDGNIRKIRFVRTGAVERFTKAQMLRPFDPVLFMREYDKAVIKAYEDAMDEFENN